MNKYCKRIAALSLVLLLLLTACTLKDSFAPLGDILTQKMQSSDQIPVSVMVRTAFSVDDFEAAAEAKFPNLDIVQVGYFTSDMTVDEIETRMKHDDLPDMMMTWPLEIGETYWADQLIDLSSMPFTSKYNTASLNTIARDGKLYFLPGPSQVRGIIYNKTMFEEQGWSVPSDFEGFVALCKKIEASGIRSLQLGLKNGEVLDAAFVGYGYQDCFSTPADMQWLSDYNNGSGNFGAHFDPALDIFQRLIDEKILQPKDLTLDYTAREQMMIERKCAMIEEATQVVVDGTLRGNGDEFAVMPFFNPGEKDNDWARLYAVCYVGLNKRLTQPANKEKYDLVLKLMDYISTPEGQSALAGKSGTMFSSLSGIPATNRPEFQPLIPALEHGRGVTFPTLKNAQSALRKGLAGMIKGEMTKEDVAMAVDAQNANPPIPALPLVLGTAEKDFTILETGNFITDAMREKSGCEIALLLDNGKDGRDNKKGISAKLYQGEITETDIKRLMPKLEYGENGELQKVKMTGENLIKALEYSIEINAEKGGSGWFYYFSGLKMEYAPAATPGSRIRKIADVDGKKIDLAKVYTVAIMDGSVRAEYIQSSENTGVKISKLLSDVIVGNQTISPSSDGRFAICQP